MPAPCRSLRRISGPPIRSGLLPAGRRPLPTDGRDDPSADAVASPASRPDAPQPEPALERHIVHGISASFLISILTIPFGFLTSVVLARVSPEALGTFGVLSLYLVLVALVLYFGGGTVTVHFMAELPRDRRLPFFVTHYLLMLLFLGVAVAAVYAWPELARAVVGIESRFLGALLLCAPLPLLCFASLAALRGLMQVALAQVLLRSLTVGTCLIYLAVGLLNLELFRREYELVVLVAYFALMGLVTVVVLLRLRRFIGGSRGTLYLPAGFWHLATALQVSSFLTLAQQSIDQIVLLRAMGVAGLGIYFVLAQLSGAGILIGGFLLEGVFPAMASLRAIGRLSGIEELYAVSARFLLLIAAVTTYVLMGFAAPILDLFGHQYVSARMPLVVMLVFDALSTLGTLNQTLIIGLRWVNRWTMIQLVRLVVFIAAFAFLSHLDGFWRVILARGLSWLLASLLAWVTVMRHLPVRPRLPPLLLWHVALTFVLAGVCMLPVAAPWDRLLPAAAGVLALALFVVGGGYGRAEWQAAVALWRERAMVSGAGTAA